MNEENDGGDAQKESLFNSSDISLIIFTFLHPQEIAYCTSVCKIWRRIIEFDPIAYRLWFHLYRRLIECANVEEAEGLHWPSKVKEIFPLLNCSQPFLINDAAVSAGSQTSSVAATRLSLMSRAGHSASLFRVQGKEIVVLFGGATHFFTYLNTVDIYSVDYHLPIRTNAPVIVSSNTIYGGTGSTTSARPAPRWLHSSYTRPDQTSAVIFGGQGESSFYNDVFLLTITPEILGTGRSSTDLEIAGYQVNSTGVLPIPGDGGHDDDNNNIPTARAGHSMVYDEQLDSAFVFGGLQSNNRCCNDLYELKLIEKTGVRSGAAANASSSSSSSPSRMTTIAAKWSKVKTTGLLSPGPRWCHSASLVGRKMIIFGGWDYERRTAPAGAAAGGAIGQQGGGGGGEAAAGRRFLNDLHILDIDTKIWSKIDTFGTPPRPRCQMACFVISSSSSSSSSSKTKKQGGGGGDRYLAEFGEEVAAIEGTKAAAVAATRTEEEIRNDVRGGDAHDLSTSSSSSSSCSCATVASERIIVKNDEEEKEEEELEEEGEDHADMISELQQQQQQEQSSTNTTRGSSKPNSTPGSSDLPSGYLVVYGGACHNEELLAQAEAEAAEEGGPQQQQPYGSLVIDLHDFKILDLETRSWIPVACSYPRCRGGVNALVECSEGWLLSGGMHSNPGDNQPRFKNDLVLIEPNLGRTAQLHRAAPSESSRAYAALEEVRVVNKFFSAKI